MSVHGWCHRADVPGRGLRRWRLVGAGASVRIALRPADLDRPRLVTATLTAVRRCLEAGAEATTYAQAARRLRTAR